MIRNRIDKLLVVVVSDEQLVSVARKSKKSAEKIAGEKNIFTLSRKNVSLSSISLLLPSYSLLPSGVMPKSKMLTWLTWMPITRSSRKNMPAMMLEMAKVTSKTKSRSQRV